jgi:alanyl-tRNA synthetase
VLRVPAEQLPKTAERFFEEWKAQQKEIERLKEELAKEITKRLAPEAENVNGINVLVKQIDLADKEELLKAATLLANQDYAAFLGSKSGNLVGAVGKSGRERGINMGLIMKDSAKILGGRGGGKPELAQGGGPNTDKMSSALNYATYSMSVILRPETEEDRERMKKAGMGRCDSCGNPVSDSDLIAVDGARRVCSTCHEKSTN